MNKKGIPKSLSIFSLVMINVSIVGNMKNWPVIAEYGASSIFYFLLATVIFFIPTALVSAELASGWHRTGGIFVWVKEAFGHRAGFLSVWLLWVQNVIWMPTALSLIAAAVAYAFFPALVENTRYHLISVLVLVWGTTYLNLRGMRMSSLISTIGVIFGTFIPGGLIILLGWTWFFEGKPVEIAFSLKNVVGDLRDLNHWIVFAGVLLSLAGMEMSAVHARDVKHPQKDYPRAIFLSGVIIFVLSLLGILSIAFVIPQNQINLVAGSLQAFSVFLEAHDLLWLNSTVAFLVAVGIFGSMSTWLAGPSKGLLGAAQYGDLPPNCRRINAHAMPSTLLIIQAVFISILSLLFILFPDINSTYWILIAVNALLYLAIYLLMFAAAIKLRYKRPHVERPYKIPGGKVGMWIVAGVGFVTALLIFFIGFLPPENILTMNRSTYALILILAVIVICLGPSFILLFKKTHWSARLPHEDGDTCKKEN